MPSGGNQQAWGWVVVTDPAIKSQVARWYREGWTAAYGGRREQILAAPPGRHGLSGRSFLAAEHLADHIDEAPVWIFPVLRNAASARNPGSAPLSTAPCSSSSPPGRSGPGPPSLPFTPGHEDDLRELLALPEDALTMGLVPLGYPARGRWARPRRLPVAEVVHWNRWGAVRQRG